jgi:hypothetical protein
LDNNSTSNGLSSNRTKLGFAAWNAFYPDNDLEKLYFLEVDYDHQIVHFYHKQSENYTSDKVLRTTNDTTKLIKQIRNLLEETAWAKYLSTENIVDLRKQIINQLIHTNQTFQEIRRDFL